MRKRVWKYQRKGVPGYWVGYYENGRRRAKHFDDEDLADRYRLDKQDQINTGAVPTEITPMDWPEMLTEYRQSKAAAEGLQDSSLDAALLTLRHFERLIGPVKSTQITQKLLERFIEARQNDPPVRGKKKRVPNGKRLSRATINKDIRYLKTFLHWLAERRYINPSVKFKLKAGRVQQAPVVALSLDQVRTLLTAAASESPAWRMRVLLAAVTGLRRGDIEALRVEDIRFDRCAITTRSHKTGKAMGERPVSPRVFAELTRYIGTPARQGRLFPDTFTSQKWKRIKEQAGLPTLKFHDLRKTFGSFLAQRGISTAVTQRLLEHATPRLTNDIYTNVDPVLRDAVNCLPVDDLLPPPIPRVPEPEKVPPVPRVPG